MFQHFSKSYIILINKKNIIFRSMNSKLKITNKMKKIFLQVDDNRRIFLETKYASESENSTLKASISFLRGGLLSFSKNR